MFSVCFCWQRYLDKTSNINLFNGLFIWYPNDFYSGMSFVPAWSSYFIHMVILISNGLSKAIRMCHLPQTTRFAIFNLERSSSFSVYMIPEWNFVQEREFYSQLKSKWTLNCTYNLCRNHCTDELGTHAQTCFVTPTNKNLSCAFDYFYRKCAI